MSKKLTETLLHTHLQHPLQNHAATSISLPSLLKSLSSPSSLPLVLQLHSFILKSGLSSDPITMNSLLSTYSRLSCFKAARQVFDTMPLRDVVSWNSMINCYAKNLCLYESVDLFRKMQFLSGYATKPELVASVLSICGRLKDLRHGREIHGHAVRNAGFESGVLLPTALVDMYSKCGDLGSALSVFGLMSERNEVSWTAMIMGCVVCGAHGLSFNIFRGMVRVVKPNRVTLVSVLQACGESGALQHGKEVHGYVLRRGFDSEPRVIAALIDMYCKFKEAFQHALFVFERDECKDIVTWSSMMVNSTRHGDNFRTMELFKKMKVEGIKPNSVTMLALLLACAGLSSMDHGRGVHCYILKSGLLSDIFIGNSLIDMYANCGCLASAVQAFYEMPIKDSVSYTCMISSYGIHGHGHEALRLFYEMKKEGIGQDSITFLTVLSACNRSGLIDKAEEVFREMKENVGDTTPSLEHYACYVDLLGKSGMVDDACNVIRTMSSRPSPKLLTSLVLACRISGKFELAESLALRLLDLEPENAANYTLLSMIRAETGNWIGKERVWELMRDRGLVKSSGSSQIQH